MGFNRHTLAVYFIFGSQDANGRDPLVILEKALQGGITCFQYREKGIGAKTGHEKYALAKQMQRLCLDYDVPFFVNDDVELAIKLNADGIHVGQDDESVTKIRQMAPREMKIGLSSTNRAQAIEAEKLEVDYIGVGPIFSTKSKDDAKKPIALAGLESIRQSVAKLPIVAIGGISKEDVEGIRRAGADGVAVISAISSPADPKAAAQSFVKMS